MCLNKRPARLSCCGHGVRDSVTWEELAYQHINSNMPCRRSSDLSPYKIIASPVCLRMVSASCRCQTGYRRQPAKMQDLYRLGLVFRIDEADSWRGTITKGKNAFMLRTN